MGESILFENAEQFIEARLFEFGDTSKFSGVKPDSFASRAFVNHNVLVFNFNKFHAAFWASHVMQFSQPVFLIFSEFLLLFSFDLLESFKLHAGNVFLLQFTRFFHDLSLPLLL